MSISMGTGSADGTTSEKDINWGQTLFNAAASVGLSILGSKATDYLADSAESIIKHGKKNKALGESLIKQNRYHRKKIANRGYRTLANAEKMIFDGTRQLTYARTYASVFGTLSGYVYDQIIPGYYWNA